MWRQLRKSFMNKEGIKMKTRLNKLVTPLLTGLALALPLQANALCDNSQARVIHAESSPFNNAGANTMVYWVAPSTTAPTFYYVYNTANQTYINLLNAALSSGKQVRITGNLAACGAAGTLRAAGTVVAVFMDTFN